VIVAWRKLIEKVAEADEIIACTLSGWVRAGKDGKARRDEEK